jgi:hypothetical protein
MADVYSPPPGTNARYPGPVVSTDFPAAAPIKLSNAEKSPASSGGSV